MKTSENRELLIRRLKEITRLKKLDADFFKEYLPTLEASVPLVDDNRRRGDLKEELQLALSMTRAMLEDDLPRLRHIYARGEAANAEERAEFQSLSEAWDESSHEVLDSLRRIAKELAGHLSKGESIANRSMNRNASFQTREMRARLVDEGYSILKRYQSQLNMAEGWLISAPTSGEGSVSNIRKFMADLNQAIGILNKGKTGYFVNFVTFLSDENIRKLQRLDDRLSRPETHYKLTNFQAEDLREADTSARRRVERMDVVTQALKKGATKSLDFLTFGLASPVLTTMGKVFRATTATARFASNLPSYASTVLSKAGDARLAVKSMARRSETVQGVKAVGRALANPKATLRNVRDVSNYGIVKKARRLTSKVSFASQTFRGAKGVRKKLGLLTKKGRKQAGMYSNPASPYYREDLGEELSRKLQDQGVTNIGSAHATDLLGGHLPDEVNEDEDFARLKSEAFGGAPSKKDSKNQSEILKMEDQMETSDDEIHSAIKSASSKGRKESLLMSERISQQIMELQSMMGLRFDNVDALLHQVIQNGVTPATPQSLAGGKTNKSVDIDLSNNAAMSQVPANLSPRQSEGAKAEEARDTEDDRSFFHRQVIALEKLVGVAKASPKKTGDLLSNSLSVLKGALSALGLGGILEMLGGLPSLFSIGSITGALLKELPAIIGKGLGSIFTPANLKMAFGMAVGGFAVDAALGAMGVGKDKDGNSIKVDKAQDDKNWERMGMWEKAYSGLARGTEGVARMFFMDNLANEAAATRIGNETKYLDGNKAGSPSATSKAMVPGRVAGATPGRTTGGTPLPSKSPDVAMAATAAAAAPPAASAGAPSMPTPSTVSTGKTADAGANSPSAKKGALFQSDVGSSMSLDSEGKANFEAMIKDYKASGGKTSGHVSATAKIQDAAGSTIAMSKTVAEDLDRKGLLSKYGFSLAGKSQPGSLVTAKAGSTELAPQASVTAMSSGGTEGITSGAPTIDANGIPTSQTAYTRLGAKMNTYTEPEEPVSEKVPPVSVAAKEKTETEPGLKSRPKVATTPASPSVGLSRVPTYSYLDGGFFIMNAGMLA